MKTTLIVLGVLFLLGQVYAYSTGTSLSMIGPNLFGAVFAPINAVLERANNK